MKKLISLLLAVAMLLCFAACGEKTPAASDDAGKADDSIDVKIGFICLHDENSTYDLNFINAAKEVVKELGLTEDQYVIKTGVPEGAECYEAAAELADDGCDIVFAN